MISIFKLFTLDRQHKQLAFHQHFRTQYDTMNDDTINVQHIIEMNKIYSSCKKIIVESFRRFGIVPSDASNFFLKSKFAS